MQLRTFFLPLLAAVAAMGQTTTTSTRSVSLPPIGLASSETAQVNVVNLATAASGGTAASCAGSISFVNASGTVIGSASSFTVTSGQIFSKTLPYSATAASARAIVRGVVSLTTTTTTGSSSGGGFTLTGAGGSSAASTPPCSLAISLETFDTTTGATHAFVPIEGTSSAGRGR